MMDAEVGLMRLLALRVEEERGHGPRSAGGFRSWKRQADGFSPRISRKEHEPARLAPGSPFWTSDSWNCNRINLCWFKLVSLW